MEIKPPKLKINLTFDKGLGLLIIDRVIQL